MSGVAAGLLALSFSTTDGGYTATLAGLILIGAGVGIAMPVAAVALMGAIPPERAGIASGLNGTLTELGNSFGIAVLGSLLSARFAAALPDALPDGAERSMSTALQATAGSEELIRSVREAFVAGMSVSLVVGACAALLGGVLSGLLLRRTERVPA
ncbi:MAG: hypothetical protein ABIQ18_02175 [Umezawaea sp.]